MLGSNPWLYTSWASTHVCGHEEVNHATTQTVLGMIHFAFSLYFFLALGFELRALPC
jgi:hypothetical protein